MSDSTYTDELMEMSANRRDVFVWAEKNWTLAVDLNRVVYASFKADDTLSLFFGFTDNDSSVKVAAYAAMDCWKRYIGESS